jgi:hypothetical protein
MNEPISIIDSLGSTPLPAPYKDRKVGLVIFGILTILLGCVAGLFVLLMFAGVATSAGTPNAVPLSSMFFAVVIYALLAAALVWLGIGSIMARRWARALLLIFSVFWLVVGLLSIPMMAFIMPKALATVPVAPGRPAVSLGAVMFIVFMVLGVIFVAMPAAWTFFYSSRHVKATCETRDPVIRWTDACPLAVLGLCLWLGMSVPILAVMPLVGWGVFPFFGTFLTGLPGDLAYLLLAAFWGYAAWCLYRLDQRGWWLILIGTCVWLISALITYARHDVTEMYRLINYPEAQIEQIQKTGLMTRSALVGMTSAFMAVFVGYLVFIKRYFRTKGE